MSFFSSLTGTDWPTIMSSIELSILFIHPKTNLNEAIGVNILDRVPPHPGVCQNFDVTTGATVKSSETRLLAALIRVECLGDGT